MQASSQELSLVKAPALPAQRLLGRYEILERLAVGGMAEIYRARTRGPRAFEKTVALKRILPQNALDPDLLQMFLDEARLMASLNHPNIAQVYDIGEDEDLPFFTMELVQGVDLRTLLRTYGRGQPLPLEHALCIAMGVAAGLHHAHERTDPRGGALGIVHRDISPSNVLVSFEGGVKITDFGVAKWTGQNSRTEAGQLKGKLAHMSPEQCRGLPLDRQTDVFALGTLLFEMLTGRPAFEAESDYELLQRIVAEDAPPLVLPDGSRGPRALEEIVQAAMRKDRTLRTPTAQLVQLALEDFARRHQLVVSSVALADTLAGLFADKRQAAEEAERRWREQAEQGPANEDARAHAAAPELSQPTRTRTAVAEEAPRAEVRAVPTDAPRGANAAARADGAPSPDVAAERASAVASPSPRSSGSSQPRLRRMTLAVGVAAAVGMAVAWRVRPNLTASRQTPSSAASLPVSAVRPTAQPVANDANHPSVNPVTHLVANPVTNPVASPATSTAVTTPALDPAPSPPLAAAAGLTPIVGAPASERAPAPAHPLAFPRTPSSSRRPRATPIVHDTRAPAIDGLAPLASPRAAAPPSPPAATLEPALALPVAVTPAPAEKPRPKVWDPDSPVPP
jgi:serine/threonine-protein kinase